MSENEQAVATEADVSAEQQTQEADGAQEATRNLDDILKEFDQESPGGSQVPEQQSQAGTDEVAALRQEVEQLRGELGSMQTNSEMPSVLSEIRGDLPVEVFDNDMVEGWLNQQAVKDKRIATAWANRRNNPAAFNEVKKALGKEFQKRLDKLPDKNATEDREAVTAAVRGASTPTATTQEVDWSQKSDAELEAEKRKLGGSSQVW